MSLFNAGAAEELEASTGSHIPNTVAGGSRITMTRIYQ
jgi:hypothetical protein